MSNELPIALIGATGKVAAPCHLNAVQMVDGLELVAVCDTEVDNLETIARWHSVNSVYSDFDNLLDDDDIDAVDIVLPHFLHADMTIAAARAGKHIYVEKPMARNVGESRLMVDMARSANVTLMVGESYYFHGPHQLAYKLIKQGEIGDVIQVRQTKAPWVFTEAENQRLGGRGHDVAWGEAESDDAPRCRYRS